MPTVRALRRSRGMTFSELALATGVSVRTLAEIEYGMQTLDLSTRRIIAEVFGLAPEHVRATAQPVPRAAREPQQLAAVGFATAASVLTLAPMLQSGTPGIGETIQGVLDSLGNQNNPPSLVVPTPTALLQEPTAAPTFTAAPTETAIPLETPIPIATTMPEPSPAPIPPTPIPAFALTAEGPRGCPLVPQPGMRIVTTQPYGVGSHAPATTWGAVDLAIDGDGDGYAEPATTSGTTIVATHQGVARIFPNSWPGGNFIIITHDESGFGTAYGHLETIAIADGQVVEPGTVVGTVGSTGMSSGPHLHYEVRTPSGNIDPAPLIGCG